MKKIIPASICAALILPTVYLLIQEIQEFNMAMLSWESDGLANEHNLSVEYMQVWATVLALGCLITIITKMLLTERRNGKSKFGAFLIKYEIPAAIVVILASAACYCAGDWKGLSALDCYMIAVPMSYLLAYPGGFFVINIIGAFPGKRK